jgi:hypothetical protein
MKNGGGHRIRIRCARLLWVMVTIGWLHVPDSTLAAPRELYVSTNAAASGSPWNSWSTAFTNIQQALDEALTGDTIYVAGHTFSLTNQIVWSAGKDDLRIIGGFAATNDVDQPGVSDPDQWPTVLRRNISARFRILDLASATNVYLQGLTFSGGYPADGQHGGGVRVTSASMTLADCVLEDNQVYIYSGSIYGGGLYVVNSAIVMSNCLVRDNRSFNGYGAWSQFSHGGGLFFSGGTSVLYNTVVRANRAHKTSFETYLNCGGGMVYQLGTHRIHNGLIAGNVGSGIGSAIWVNNAATRLGIENTTLAGNVGGPALYVASGTVAVTNSIFWQNEGDLGGGGTLTLASCNTEDGYDAGNNGNISADPVFERGFYLGEGSASTNAGTGTAADWGLEGRTTRAAGTPSSGPVDQGYHFASGLDWATADFYVSPDGSDANSGTNWIEAFATVSHAVSQAQDGTRIHLATGDYNNTGVAVESFPIALRQRWGVQLLGADAAQTRIVRTDAANTRLMDLDRIAGDALIRGLTFAGGYPADGQVGGAIRMIYCAVAIDDCRFLGNTVRGQPSVMEGGALHVTESLLLVSASQFATNRAINRYGATSRYAEGGAIYFLRGRSHLDGLALIGNRSYKDTHESFASRGGAIVYTGGRHVLSSSLVASNEATGTGAGIYLASGDLSLLNVTLAAHLSNPALYGAAGLAITNSIFWNNAGGDFVNVSPDAIWYSCATGLTHGVQGNISDDPLFVGGGNFRLTESLSPALDAGINHDGMLEAVDLAGTNRILRGRKSATVDLGAYETPPPADTGLAILARPAQAIEAYQATANALLLGTGPAENPEVYLCWGSAALGQPTATGDWSQVDALGDAWDAPAEIWTAISPLDPGENYAYRFYVTNSVGDDWSEAVFFTSIGFPEITNNGVEWVRYRQARVRGTVTDDGGEPVTVWIEYWPASAGAPTSTVAIGDFETDDTFSATIGALIPDTEYEFRFAASNVLTTVYTEVDSFTTLAGDPFVWYVALDGDASSGVSWGDAFPTLAEALAVTEPGDTIYVAGHTFSLTSQIVWIGSQHDVRIIGGFAATNDVDQPGVSDPDQWPTVLQRSVTNRFRILDVSGVTNIHLQGLTFSGGYPADGEHGGGVRVTDSRVTFSGCVLQDNEIYVYSGSIYGGGLYSVNSAIVMTNCLVRDNRSFNGYGTTSQGLSHGGGLFFSGGTSVLYNTVVRANRAHKTSFETYLNCGGGIVYQLGTHRIHNGLMAGNVGSGIGSAIWVNNAATRLVIENTTLAGNVGGPALYVASGTVAVTNSIFWQNEGDLGGGGTLTLASCNTEDGYDAGNNGNISAEPMFERGFYLGDGSASTNAGTGTAADWGLAGRTTRAAGTPSSGTVDQGYHFDSGLDWATADFYVSPGGSDAHPGTNWSEPFRTITHALEQARDGTRIHLAAGVYTNDISGGEQFPLLINDRWGIQLLGAGADATLLRVERGVRQRLLNVSHTAGDTLFSGLTLTQGYPANGEFGGAVHILYGWNRIDDCVLSDNESTIDGWTIRGGGMYVREARLRIDGCCFTNNRARNAYGAAGGVASGGGLYVFRGRSRIDRTEWIGNRSYSTFNYPNQASYGGALYFQGGQHRLSSSLVVSNEATGSGAGIYVDGVAVELLNITMADNLRTRRCAAPPAWRLPTAFSGTLPAAILRMFYWMRSGIPARRV